MANEKYYVTYIYRDSKRQNRYYCKGLIGNLECANADTLSDVVFFVPTRSFEIRLNKSDKNDAIQKAKEHLDSINLSHLIHLEKDEEEVLDLIDRYNSRTKHTSKQLLEKQ